MEENIFIVESFLKNKKMLLKHPVWVSEQTLQAIENLINKYKEQEEQINLTEKVQQNYKNAFYEKSIENTKLRDKIAEQEKIIELMHEDMKLEGYLKMTKEELYEYYKKRIKIESEDKQ